MGSSQLHTGKMEKPEEDETLRPLALLEARLKNWSNYYRQKVIQKTCGSIEKRYQANWRQWIELKDLHISKPIDIWDAQEVEKAWKHMLGKHKLILKYTYMTPWLPEWVICRKARVKRWRLEIELRQAKHAIGKMLDKLKDNSQNSATICYRAPTRETLARREGLVRSERTQ